MFGIGIPELILIALIVIFPIAVVFFIVGMVTKKKRVGTIDELERLASLKERGALTEAELAEQKRKLLAR